MNESIKWFRVWGRPNNEGGPWIGEGKDSDYRIDHEQGWATLSVYTQGPQRPDRTYATVKGAKVAASRIEQRRVS
jgi:hypothetical protein